MIVKGITAKKRIDLIFILGVAGCSILFIVPTSAQGTSQQGQTVQFDLQGDAHFSRYNFTDIRIPYNGVDSWMEFKIAYWLNDTKTLSPYLSIIPTLTSVSEFWWQKNVQVVAGLQWYPITGDMRHLRSIRFFALIARRAYLDQPGDVQQEDVDAQFGADYYFDDLFEDKRLISIAWSNAGFRNTNFSLDDYSAFLWTGNIKVGIKPELRGCILLAYLFSEWAYVPKHKKHWWENFLRFGGGVRFYPKSDGSGNFLARSFKRFHIYAEVLHNIAWLGDRPNVDAIEETDFRVGLGLSTGGFFRDQR